jgi:hypothetical protein
MKMIHGENISKQGPLDLDEVEHIYVNSSGTYGWDIRFFTKNRDVTWSFSSNDKEKRDLYVKKILSLVDSINIAEMTTL